MPRRLVAQRAHEEFGVVTLRQQVSHFAAHEITHLPQIASAQSVQAGRMIGAQGR